MINWYSVLEMQDAAKNFSYIVVETPPCNVAYHKEILHVHPRTLRKIQEECPELIVRFADEREIGELTVSDEELMTRLEELCGN